MKFNSDCNNFLQILTDFSIITKIKYNEWNKYTKFCYLRWVGYLDIENILWVRCGVLDCIDS